MSLEQQYQWSSRWQELLANLACEWLNNCLWGVLDACRCIHRDAAQLHTSPSSPQPRLPCPWTACSNPWPMSAAAPWRPQLCMNIRLTSWPARCCAHGVTSEPGASLACQLENHAPLIPGICTSPGAALSCRAQPPQRRPTTQSASLLSHRSICIHSALHCSCRAGPTWKPHAALVACASR